MIKVEITKKNATVYNSDGSIVNTGSRPQDYAFARNVANAEGYKKQEESNSGRRTVRLWKPV